MRSSRRFPVEERNTLQLNVYVVKALLMIKQQQHAKYILLGYKKPKFGTKIIVKNVRWGRN